MPNTVVIEQDGPDVTVVIEEGVKGDTGDMGPAGADGAPGTLAGSVGGIPLARSSVVADSWTLPSYCPYPFTITHFRNYSVGSGSFTLTIYRNGVQVLSFAVDTNLRTQVLGFGSVNFAAGDALKVTFSSLSSSPLSDFSGTLVYTRTG